MEMKKKGRDIAAVLAEDFHDTLAAGIDVAIGPEDFDERLRISAPYPNIFHTTGLSPFWASVTRTEQVDALDLVEKQLDHPRVIAVGEIGLDWHWDYGDRKGQIDLFKYQIEVAEKNDLPVIIHNRDADSELINTLHTCRPSKAGIIHCFSSTFETAVKLIDMGFLISFAGNMTYKKAENLREVLVRLPIDSIIFETDAPYLTPIPHRGKPNRPGYVSFVYDYASQLKNIDIEALKNKVCKNIYNLFPILR
jgi:TatD DNase family protein